MSRYWECVCGEVNDELRETCSGVACDETRDRDEIRRCRARIDAAAYRRLHGIISPPPERHYTWRDFMDNSDA